MEPPQQRILLLEDTDDFVRWRIPCFCDDSRHDWMFEIEYDKKWNDVIMYIYANVYTAEADYHQNWFIDKWRDISKRVRIALRVLFLGYAEYSCDLGFKSEQQIYDLADLLTSTVDKLAESGDRYGEVNPEILEEGD